MTTSRTAAPLTTGQVQRQGPVGRLVAAHPRGADAVLAVAVLLVGLVTAAMALQTVDGSTALGLYRRGAAVTWTVPTAWLAGAVLGAGLLTVRRRWPLGTAAALTGLAVVSLGAAGILGVLGLCLACAIYTVAATRPARTAWLVSGAVVVVVVAALWWWQQIGLAEILLWGPQPDDGSHPARQLEAPPFSSGRRAVSATLLLGLVALGLATGSAARARRLYAQELVGRYEAMARDRDQSAALARAAERARIAREMHDVVAHSVSVMVALSDGAGAALDRAPERSREALRELSRTGRESLADLQRVLGVLDPDRDGDGPDRSDGGSDDHQEPAVSDLAGIVERFRAAGVPVTATGLDAVLPLDTSLRLAVARIVTEALTNVLRHAPGTPSARVVVRRTASTVEVEVLDDGGTRPGAGGGTGRGILGMRERAAILGGSVGAGPRPEGGWRVRVVLPWDDDTDDRENRT